MNKKKGILLGLLLLVSIVLLSAYFYYVPHIRPLAYPLPQHPFPSYT